MPKLYFILKKKMFQLLDSLFYGTLLVNNATTNRPFFLLFFRYITWPFSHCNWSDQFGLNKLVLYHFSNLYSLHVLRDKIFHQNRLQKYAASLPFKNEVILEKKISDSKFFPMKIKKKTCISLVATLDTNKISLRTKFIIFHDRIFSKS